MNTRWMTMATLALLGAHGMAAAQPAKDALYVRSLAATCANCHGTDGHGAPGSTVPLLAGQSREALLASLKAFKAGSRPATVMQQLAKGYTDAQLEQLAGYFAAQAAQGGSR